jgi:glycosyltransferase involved in cell wall biosynthesis
MSQNMEQKRPQKRRVKVSLVFPAYNEAEKLQEAVYKAIETLEEFTGSYEVLVAEDGSTDDTDRIASRLSRRHPFIKHIHSDRRLGRGAALKRAFTQSSGEILVYMDVDLATDIKHLKTLVDSIREGYDVAVGSRMLPESRVNRAPSRKGISNMYNFLVKTLLGSKIRDHQCGFKAFRRASLLGILDEIEDRHWFWDTELLIRSQRRGYAIKEIPVEWKAPDQTKVHLLEDSLTMGIKTLKLRWKLCLSSGFEPSMTCQEDQELFTE